ncbi:MAG: aspartate-semialdehyde dehydrogenase [Flavobacteriales bacterium]|nr:aspartate-semialdehyde dehydrogenase [Flavobacteriales bacterium]|tara:strand:- start:1943 stop:2923 length:981 start_codon:yes stop_codon:yes gene_type:complete
MVIALIGATGLVGKEIIKKLEKNKTFKNFNFLFVASEKNKNKEIVFRNNKYKLETIEEAIKKKPKYVLFSAGSAVAKRFAEKFTKTGAVVIDNSSAFRMKKKHKLIVPEINGNKITLKDRIIANPNCSTIQLVLSLFQIHKKIGVKRLIVSTYQSVSGSGQKGLDQLQREEKKEKVKKPIYLKKIYNNAIPHCDTFLKNGYTKEEEKIIFETNKILDSKIKITATAVRIPTNGGHGESVNVELKKQTSIEKIINLLNKQEGLKIGLGKDYKTPIEVKGRDEVFVSRIRKDTSCKKSFNMWIVADPLRKGAATNAIQILEKVISLNN